MQAHRYEQAIEQARRSLQLEPGLPEANACITGALIDLRNYKAALAQMNSPLKAELAKMDTESAFKWLTPLRVEEAEKTTGKSSPFNMAMSYALLNENAKALDALERAYESRSLLMPLLGTEPAFRSLKTEPRFQALIRKVGVPQ